MISRSSIILRGPLLVFFCVIGIGSLSGQDMLLGSLNSVALEAELKTVKLYGAGGIAGLDSYQSGFYISDQGHILTVWSTVLDVDTLIAISSDGTRNEASVVGIDPNLEIAILATGKRPSGFFDWEQTVEAQAGERVLAFSNLFGIAAGSERSSIQQGNIMAITDLQARRGFIESVYQGKVYVIDAMTNNPGAAGGALTNVDGQLLGLLGKELRDNRANIWLNYAIPMSVLRESIRQLLSGETITRAVDERTPADRPCSLADLGITLIPDVLSKTPAYIDLVQPNSKADRAGLQSDDLILFVNTTRIVSQASLIEELNYIDRADNLVLLVQRGRELKEFDLSGP